MKTAFDPAKAKLAAACETPGILYALCHDAPGNRLYGAGADWSVYSVDLTAEKPTAVSRWTNHQNYVSALSLLGDLVASASYDGRIIWTQVDTGQQVRAVDAHEGWIRDMDAFPGGDRLVSVGDDMLVKVWSAESGELLSRLEGHDKQTPQGYATAIYAVAVAPDGKHIASGDRVGAVCLWDADSGELVRRLQAPGFYTYDATARVRSIGGIRSLCFSPDGATLAIGGIGKVTNVDGFVGPCRVELWDWRSGKRVGTREDKHNAVLNDVRYHPTEPWLIAAGGGDSGGVFAFWSVASDSPAAKAKPKGHIQRFVVDPDGTRLFAAGHGGFQIWTFGDA